MNQSIDDMAHRIEAVLDAAHSGMFRSDEDFTRFATDVDYVADRFRELKSGGVSFSEASRQARVEFIRQVLNEGLSDQSLTDS